MDKLLAHIEQITGERERPQINIALARAFRDLLGTCRVTIFTILQAPGEAFVWSVAKVDESGAHILDDGLSVPGSMVSIEYYPQLNACLQSGAHKIFGDETVFPISKANGSVSGFVMLSGKTLNDSQIAIVDHLLTIFTNVQSLLDYSEIDTLTGLLNRKTFERHLMRILYRLSSDDDGDVKALHLPQRRHGRTDAVDYWLAVVDIDHFKRVNDSFGHLIGDEMLLLIATLMKSSFRVHDQLFRFGGEEFVVLLKPTEEQNAHAAFERFRTGVASFAFPQAGQLTVSVGYVRVKCSAQPSLVLEHADAALYWAKENGRNQVVQYDAAVAAASVVPKKVNSEVEFF